MDIDVESQASQQEDTVAAVDEKPFRHTKPEGIVSKLYSYQLESLTWMTVSSHISPHFPCFLMVYIILLSRKSKIGSAAECTGKLYALQLSLIMCALMCGVSSQQFF